MIGAPSKLSVIRRVTVEPPGVASQRRFSTQKIVYYESIEFIMEVEYDPVAAEASDQIRIEDPIHLAQDMRFKAAIRGWSPWSGKCKRTAI